MSSDNEIETETAANTDTDTETESEHESVDAAGDDAPGDDAPADDTERFTAVLETISELLDHGSELVLTMDLAGRCSYVSPAIVRLSGFSPDELIGHPADVLIHADDRDRVEAAALALVTAGPSSRPVIFRHLHKDGGFRHLEARLSHLPAGHPLGTIVLTAIDITNRIESEQTIRESHNIVRMVAEGRGVSDVLTAVAHFVERKAPGCSVTVLRLEGPDHLRVAAAPSVPTSFVSEIDGIEAGPSSGACGVAARLRSQVITSDISRDPRWLDLRDEAIAAGFEACWSTPLIGAGGQMLGTLALYWPDARLPSAENATLMTDASLLASIALERSRIEDQLLHVSSHDSLTGLPNRSLLQDRLHQALARRRRGQLGEVGFFYVDIDDFASVNAAHTHAGGDVLLMQVADRLRAIVREVDTVARFSGDEFIVLAHTHSVETLAERIRDSISAPFADLDDISVTVSIGIAVAGEDESQSSLLRRSHRALIKAKQSGRNLFEIDGVDTGDGGEVPSPGPTDDSADEAPDDDDATEL